MLKKYVHKLTSAVLLLIMVSALICAAAVSVSADDSNFKTLIVDYDSNCSVTLTVNNEEQPKFETNTPIEIPYPNEGVSVSIKPNRGYDIDAIYEVENGVEKKLDIATVNRKWSIGYFNRDITLKIVCKTKTYKIEFLPEAKETELSYEFFDSVMPTSYTYKGAPVTIGPVRKNSGVKDAEGYLFKGWEVVHKEADGTLKTIGSWSLEPGQTTCEIGSDITVFDEWQESGVIYLRPYFDPKEYPVWRDDIVVYGPQDLREKAPLSPDLIYMGTAPMAEAITGAMKEGEVSPYPGYVCIGGSDHRVTMDENDEKKNQVKRYFLPISYQLVFDTQGGSLVDPDFVLSEKHVYDQTTPLPALKKVGYTFVGWSVRVNGTEVQLITDPENLCLEAGNSKYAENNDGADQQTLQLVAVWNADPYRVEYDLAGAIPSENPDLPSEYVFDTALKIPTPMYAGYQFVGWIINGDTDNVWNPSAAVPELVLAAESYTDTIRLTAVWKAKSFQIVLDSNGGFPTAGSVLKQHAVFDQPLNTAGIQLPTRSQYAFLGFFFEGVKYINADGSPACETWDLYTEDGSALIVLKAEWELLPVMEVDPSKFELDYIEEKFRFPQGSYLLTFDGVTAEFTVDADGFGAGKIPESFFGNTVDLTARTPDDKLYSDYHGALTLQARPVAPTHENGVIDQVFSTNTTVQILFMEGVEMDRYETALYLNGKSVVSWGNYTVFENLKEGTSYVVLVRVKATKDAPCSLYTQFDRDTDSKGFKTSLYQKLDDLIQPGDGDMVHALIGQAKNDIAELTHSVSFYDDANQIVADTAEAVIFARYQDQKIMALRNYRDALLNTKAYNQTNQMQIEAIFASAETSIRNATEDKAVGDAYDAAYQAMSNIKITYLQSGDMFLTSIDGLHKDYTLTLVRHPDFITQADQVNSAIAAGKVFGGGSPEELVELLKTKDVMAAYTMSLSGTDYTGRFKVTMLLPEELRGVSGLRVAYFDKTTGALEVLETQTEGDYLVFYADNITDFVILGDPVLNVIVPMIALGIVAICQLIAIALLLKGRSESKKAVRNYSFVLPMALTIQFFPKNGELVVLILGALVILLQIILTVLLLRSDVIHKSRLKRRAPRPDTEEAIPTMARAEDVFETSAPVMPLDMEDDRLGEQSPVQEISEDEQAVYYALDEEYAEDPAEVEEEPFYYGSVNTENVDEGVFVDTVSYEFDQEGTEESEMSEDPDGNETLASGNDGVYVVAEDGEEDPIFSFDEDEDLAYGDPADPPYDNEPLEEDSKNEF